MKNSSLSVNLSKVVKTGVITLSLAALPLSAPVFAQTTAPGTAPSDTTPGQTTVPDQTIAPGDTTAPSQTTTTTAVDNDNDGFSWGWLGLLGLIGLAGLGGRRDESRHTTDAGTVSRPGVR